MARSFHSALSASQDPHQQVRDLVAPYLFGTAALVAAVGILLFLVFPPGLGWLRRSVPVGVHVALLATCVGAQRMKALRRSAGLTAVSLLVVVLVAVDAWALNWGLATPSNVFLALHGAVLALGLGAAVLLSRLLGRCVEASAEREQRFLGLLSIAADAYWEMDAQLRVTTIWKRSPGGRGFVPAHRRDPRPSWEMRRLHIDDDALDAHRADLEARRPFRELSGRWLCPDGSLRHVVLSGEPRFDARGVFTGYWGVVRDATDEARALDAMAATEARYQELFNRLPTPLLLHRHGRVLDANPAAVALLGYGNLAAMRGADMLAIYEPGEHHERARTRLAELEQMDIGEALVPAEFRLQTRDGRRLVVRATAVRVQTDSGPANLSIYLDDTDRRAAEEAVRRSEELLSHLVATSPDVITLTDLRSGRYAMVNDTFLRLMGWSAAEVIGHTSTELGIWADGEDRERLVRALREQDAVKDMPAEFSAKDGHRISLLVSAARFVMDGSDYLVINARDVTDTERTRKELEAILQNASIGIAFTRDRRFVQANARCEQMFGWPPGELAGQPGSVVWPTLADHEALGRELGPALGAGQQVETERMMRRRDGSTFLCRILAKAVDPARPRTGGTIWILDDVTERRLVDQVLAKARDDAEAASRAKSAFLANTSHELRTPLNGLVGLTRLARQPDIDDAQRRHYLEQISDSAETLSAIINDILDLSKIEAGKLHLETLAFDLHGLLQSLDRTYGTLARTRGLEFRIDIGAGVPRHVFGDPVRVRQVLGNYLSNALKFTAHGALTLRVLEAGDERLRFEVHDSGPGIDPQVQERLFRPFVQADQSTTRRFGGTGLGLSICHELAVLMGGEVGVDSWVGRGSCFWAELPLPAADPGDAQSAFGTLDADGTPAGARVLMVEDNPVNMMIGVALLEQWGVKVTQATTGRQAIAAVEEAAARGRPFDVVLMDVQMPEMSGHEATRILRQRHDAATLPIIALTAAALVSEREEALAAGMNDFLTKPIDADRLRRALVAALEQREGR